MPTPPGFRVAVVQVAILFAGVGIVGSIYYTRRHQRAGQVLATAGLTMLLLFVIDSLGYGIPILEMKRFLST